MTAIEQNGVQLMVHRNYVKIHAIVLQVTNIVFQETNIVLQVTNIVLRVIQTCVISNKYVELKGVFAKNERGYRLTAKSKRFLIATNLTFICCVYKEKIVKNDSYQRT